MRAFQLILPLALMASPALAQTRPTPPPETITVPPELTDPAMADRLGGMMQALSKAFLNLPVGEIEAAAEGRPATRADRNRTIGDLGRQHDPNFEQHLDRDIEASRGAVQASMKAFTAALPAVTRSIAEARRAIEQATANLPSPVYPRR
ncbi:hypothetical protein [Sphingomonas sp.]|uniref:hypothetical protein n=1 Tax=Sphingomonas sp. TaxID=28214 RepID=UPI00286B44A5|nr:hypothetical protein [Sphingomonas sp.]